MIREQLAGDELPGESPDALIATGYYRLGLWDDEPADHDQARFDELDDLVATTSQSFLGITMNCARCHDHKIDPFPQTDYYKLLACFEDVRRYDNSQDPKSSTFADLAPRSSRKYEAALKEAAARKSELGRDLSKLENEVIKRMPAEDQRASEGPDRPAVLRKLPKFFQGEEKNRYTQIKQQIQEIDKRPFPARELALCVANCNASPAATHVMVRGNAHSPGIEVHAGFPEIFTMEPAAKPTDRPGTFPISTPASGATTSGRRTALANWIASKNNPLTARVMVNRIWQHHFGRGIVPTPNDFGKFGEKPSHPELLDWLASDFMAGGWKIKRLQKLILMSSAYRMSSQANEAGLKADPANYLLWRFNMRRLTAEEIRDSILTVSGNLNLKMGGPSIYPPISKEVLAGQSVPGSGWNTSSPEESARRSVYVHVKRSLLLPILSTHDSADTDVSCPVRYITIVPTQALGMLNGKFIHDQSAALAARLKKEAPDGLESRIRLAIRLTTGRPPGEEEVIKDAAFISKLEKTAGMTPAAAFQNYCLMILNTNEFVYLD